MGERADFKKYIRNVKFVTFTVPFVCLFYFVLFCFVLFYFCCILCIAGMARIVHGSHDSLARRLSTPSTCVFVFARLKEHLNG